MRLLLCTGETPNPSFFSLSHYEVRNRRFRDFAELNSQVKQNLKGHHLREILPPLPEKPLKSFTDHRDPVFIADRQAKLNIYLTALVAIPHVCDMICVRAFLGMMEQVQ